MKKYFAVIWCLAAIVMSGCGQGNERLQEKATIEGKANSQATIEAENANLASKVQAMENDLDRRHRFYEAIEGVYTGTLETEPGDEFTVEMVFNSSLPRYPTSNRTRTLEELSYEANNLYIVAQVKEWSKTATDPILKQAFGCIFEQVRPDLVKGKIFLASEACKKTYTLYLTPPDTDQPIGDFSKNGESRIKISRDLARRVLEGSLRSISGLVGMKKTNLSMKTFNLSLRKESPELAAQ